MPRPPHAHPGRPRHRWLHASVAGTLYGAALLATLQALHARQARHGVPMGASTALATAGTLATGTLGAALPDAAHRSRRATAYLVARADDCTANFEFLTLFERTPVRARLDLAGVLAIGDETVASTLRRALTDHGLDLRVWPAPPAARAALAGLGHRTTPYLVVLDGDGAVRFAIGAPETVHQYLALGATLPLIGDPDSTSARP